ncbi:hypothetical protein [Edaphosphingomonas haloaromaticamans]|uniref:Uncharacterized protein n=1 Tax=Edaphosphingomonas haloaromaticamans TaxID=653954 RepID=A0A1S1HHJ7_9SPHN|nr:hypothetical protein [Sphingomonas haloaromaticamans]OHT21769.1 hypothetical protein BHE75_03780 [Sphingomonas haloaromaticamans]
MKEFVNQTNIERFENLLASETDACKATTLRGLLAVEKAKAVAARRSEPGDIRVIPAVPVV